MIPLLANPWVLVAAGVAIAGSIGSAYVKGRSDGRAVEVSERVTLDEVARESREAAIAGAAEQIAKIQVKHVTIQQKAQTVLREIPVYRDCLNDDRVVRMLDAARANEPYIEPAGGGELSGSGASAAPDIR